MILPGNCDRCRFSIDYNGSYKAVRLDSTGMIDSGEFVGVVVARTMGSDHGL